MKKVKITMGGIVMTAITVISERGEVVLLCLLAALIHELGHLIAAKIRGIAVDRLELGFMGARIVVDDGLCSYRSEMILALGGPMGNLFTLAASLTAAKMMGVNAQETLALGAEFIERGGGIVGALGCLALASCAQMGLNMLPVRSLDGGRIASAAVSDKFGSEAGERVIALFTSVALLCLWTVALYLMLRVGAGLAVFTFAACVFFGCCDEG